MTRNLSAACQLLHNADPEAWDLFVKAFDEFSGDVTATVIAAEADQLVGAQGQARICLKLQRIFKEWQLVLKQPAPR